MAKLKFLHKRKDILPYVEIVQKEADKEKKSLGFLSAKAYESAAYSEKIVIAVSSENDEYVSLGSAKIFAEKWGSQFVNVGEKGHINSNSNLGDWNEGLVILDDLIKKVK